MLAKRVDQGTAEVEDAVLKCDIRERRCPMGWYYVDRGTRCFCFPGVGFLKRDAGLATREDTSDSRVLYDPHGICAHKLKGKCAPGTVGLWDSREGRCYCGRLRKSNIEIVPREEGESSRVPFDPHVYCANRVKCPSGSVGLWDNRAGRCYCGLRRANIDINTRDEAEASRLQYGRKTLTTANVLANHLMGEHLTFPTGISNPDWTAIQATLAILHEYINSQPDLHQVCTGAKNPQAYGFKLEIFRRICKPEIVVPIPHPEIEKAEQKVNSALFIDTILQRNKNNFGSACNEAEASGVIPSPLDRQWILLVLCHQGH
jgi:hypothetical protein